LGGFQHLTIDLSILGPQGLAARTHDSEQTTTLDRSRLGRALLDLAPNAWLVWEWVDQVVRRLRHQGMAESVLSGSVASLTERLSIDIEYERDRLTQGTFNGLVEQGLVQFSLKADAMDYELPYAAEWVLPRQPPVLQHADAHAIEKSLLEPVLRTPDMNELDAAFAAYLDQKTALRWWHRNVAAPNMGCKAGNTTRSIRISYLP